MDMKTKYKRYVDLLRGTVLPTVSIQKTLNLHESVVRRQLHNLEVIGVISSIRINRDKWYALSWESLALQRLKEKHEVEMLERKRKRAREYDAQIARPKKKQKTVIRKTVKAPQTNGKVLVFGVWM